MTRKCPYAVMRGEERATGGVQKVCTTPGTKPRRKGQCGNTVWKSSQQKLNKTWLVSQSLLFSPEFTCSLLSGIYTVIISKHLATLGRKKFLFKRKKQPEDPGSGRGRHLP